MKVGAKSSPPAVERLGLGLKKKGWDKNSRVGKIPDLGGSGIFPRAKRGPSHPTLLERKCYRTKRWVGKHPKTKEVATTQLFVSKKHTRWVDITCERNAAKGITGWRKFPITSGTLFATNTEEVPNPKAQTQKSKQRNQLCKPSKHKVEDRTSAQKIKWSFFRKKLNTYFRLQVLTRCFTGLSNEYALVYIDKLYINI